MTFDFSPADNKNIEKIQENNKPSLGYWQDAWLRLKKDKMAMAGLCFIVFLMLFCILIRRKKRYNCGE